jgi:hypothetical protein
MDLVAELPGVVGTMRGGGGVGSRPPEIERREGRGGGRKVGRDRRGRWRKRGGEEGEREGGWVGACGVGEGG